MIGRRFPKSLYHISRGIQNYIFLTSTSHTLSKIAFSEEITKTQKPKKHKKHTPKKTTKKRGQKHLLIKGWLSRFPGSLASICRATCTHFLVIDDFFLGTFTFLHQWFWHQKRDWQIWRRKHEKTRKNTKKPHSIAKKRQKPYILTGFPDLMIFGDFWWFQIVSHTLSTFLKVCVVMWQLLWKPFLWKWF